MYLLKRLIPKKLTLPITGENAELQELSFIAGGNTKWYNHVEDSLEASYNVIHGFIIRSSNPDPHHLPN